MSSFCTMIVLMLKIHENLSEWCKLTFQKRGLPTLVLLPPASVGWGKVIVSLCLLVHKGGGVPPSGLGWVGTPIKLWTGGYPHPALDGGVPPASLGRGYRPGVGTPPPTQGWMGIPSHMPLAFTQEDFLVFLKLL